MTTMLKVAPRRNTGSEVIHRPVPGRDVFVCERDLDDVISDRVEICYRTLVEGEGPSDGADFDDLYRDTGTVDHHHFMAVEEREERRCSRKYLGYTRRNNRGNRFRRGYGKVRRRAKLEHEHMRAAS